MKLAKAELLVPAKLRRPGRPRKAVAIKKASVEVVKPESLEEALGNLLFFDARCLDRETRTELLRVLPQLFQTSRSWMARFAEYGCLCCHKKKVPYGSGGLCRRCHVREFNRIREWYRKKSTDVDGLVASLTLRFDAAQRLFNGEGN